MRKLFGFILATTCFLAIASPLPAHHGTAGYDTDKQLVMQGTVTEWLWANPHCFLKYDTANEKGEVAHWAAEVSNPIDMIRRGWSKRILNPGDQATVTVRPAKNGALSGNS